MDKHRSPRLPQERTGQVTVILLRAGDDWCLAVRDDGIGSESKRPEAGIDVGSAMEKLTARHKSGTVKPGRTANGLTKLVV